MARRQSRFHRHRRRLYRAGPLSRFRKRVRWLLAQRARVSSYRRFFPGRSDAMAGCGERENNNE